MKWNGFAFLREGQGVKSLLVVAMMIITATFVVAEEPSAGSGFSLAGGKFGEINLKVGLDFESDIRGHVVYDSMDFDISEVQPTGTGISLGSEYLYAIPLPPVAVFYHGFLKIGAGASYMFPRTGYDEKEENETKSETTDFSLLPVYGIIQLNPAQNLPGLFIRGLIGYAFSLQWDPHPDDGEWSDQRKGGLHWGVAAGYEFSWGLFIEYTYTQSNFSVEMSAPLTPPLISEFTYGKSGVTIGYKIKL